MLKYVLFADDTLHCSKKKSGKAIRQGRENCRNGCGIKKWSLNLSKTRVIILVSYKFLKKRKNYVQWCWNRKKSMIIM